MLQSLSIRDVVLIERLDLTFASGLGVLTGETGAGKSILLDALGLVLGARAESGLVRRGGERAIVTASFALPDDHPARALMAEQDMAAEDSVVLRRTVGSDGRSRAFVDDQPVSIGLLRALGGSLVEIHGQFDTHGLLDSATHRGVLDAYGRHDALVGATAQAWQAWQAAATAAKDARIAADAAARDADYLRHASDELYRLAPEVGEEEALGESRARLMARDRLIDALTQAERELSGSKGVVHALGAAQRVLERASDKAAGAFDAALAGLERAAIEAADALAEIEIARRGVVGEDEGLENVDDRLFALRAAARKYGVGADDLAALAAEMSAKVAAIDDASGRIAALDTAAAAARATFEAAAGALSAARRTAAAELDQAVAAELPPLKLERARFRTVLTPLGPAEAGAHGNERVAFEATTNPGAAFASLAKVASGGELARFMLALKVVLARLGNAGTLIFDEVDAGVGGATADAVGERLARLAEHVQVLVVTHSPQVAARAAQHLRVAKTIDAAGAAVTGVEPLDPAARHEEIARMLSGSVVTDAARQAAASLVLAARR